MKIAQFSSLSDKIQLATVAHEGVYIGKRMVNGRAVLLYQHHSFYVEIFYRIYRRHVERIVMWEDTSVLDLYPEI